MINKEIVDTLSGEFRARLCPLEAIKALRGIENGYNPNQLNSALFPVGRSEVLRRLIEFGYVKLLLTLLGGVEIHVEARDTFASEMDRQFIELIDEVLKEQRQEITAVSDERGVWVTAPDFLLDLVLPAISQIHSEFELTANQFHDLFLAANGNKESLFLNAKGASRASNAIMCWVASNMGIPMGYGIDGNQITGVS